MRSCRALEEARRLRASMPAALARRYGDLEGFDWWEQHEELFNEARQEYGQKRPEVYHLAAGMDETLSLSSKCLLEQATWIQEPVREALLAGTETALESVLTEVCRDSTGLPVYTLDLFTEEFCDALLEELDHLEESGIPLRRPNGMNRYGAILSQLGFQDNFLLPLTTLVMAPFARMLWPEWVSPDDCGETYGFVVRYRMGEDVDLQEHSDTSNVTLNVCLGREFTGGELYFKGVRFTASEDDVEENIVGHVKGRAMLHLGGHRHAALPITSGERSNLIVWATAPGGVVRIRPDPDAKKKQKRLVCGLS